jgi:NitT/TauT family transport system substrate-binding protein
MAARMCLRRRDVLLAAAALVGTPSRAGAQSGRPDALVRVATGGGGDVAPLLYGFHAGLFKKAGILLQITRMSSDGAVMAAVFGSSAEIGQASLLNVLGAHAKNVPLKLIAPGALYQSERLTVAAVVQKQSTLRSAQDFNGKVVSSTTLHDVNVLAMRAWIDGHGGDSTSVKFVEISPLESVVAVIQGRIDVALLGDPTLSEALGSGKTRVVAPVFDGIARRYLISGWFAMQDYADGHADIRRRFADVMRISEAFCNAHPEETVGLVAAFTGINTTLVAHMTPPAFPAALEGRDIQPVIDTAAKYKWFEGAFRAADVISGAATGSSVK